MKLQTKLKELEMKYKNINVQRPGLMQEIGKIKERNHWLHNVEIEKNLIFLKQCYYEAGSRSLKLLSFRLRKQQVDNTIYKIRDPKTKRKLHRLAEIHEQFEICFKKLYTENASGSEIDIKAFVSSLQLPRLTEEPM